MAVTSRLGLTLLEESDQGKATRINANANLIDAGVAVLAATNTFAALQTLAAGLALAGTLKGSSSPLTLSRLAFTFSADADQTLTSTEYSNIIIEIQAGVLTVTRNLIFPTVLGAIWIVRNANTQAVVCKTAAGTGVTVAASRVAIIWGGAANILRLTADSLTT